MGYNHWVPSDNVKALFEFIAYFESDGKKYDVSEELGFDPYRYHDQANHFINLLYCSNIIVSFDWSNWSKEANAYFNSPSLIVDADLITIRRLFTTIIRADRFVSGYYAGKLDAGIVLILLKRLKILCDINQN
ncbi:DUF6508 domain-containing protein [Paenibacillus piri]|uniref:Uncharacterized protein n=1 Tax=Paenibacillus piri TaxID=2547395 RepID=A0A4R5KKV6_9BACL|nr:DUF6508 domain-containing protein [Paenibacillus piri]TDF95485.1 hypothetical protein E1757_20500 [Paenibacillus piri]